MGFDMTTHRQQSTRKRPLNPVNDVKKDCDTLGLFISSLHKAACLCIRPDILIACSRNIYTAVCLFSWYYDQVMGCGSVAKIQPRGSDKHKYTNIWANEREKENNTKTKMKKGKEQSSAETVWEQAVSHIHWQTEFELWYFLILGPHAILSGTAEKWGNGGWVAGI